MLDNRQDLRGLLDGESDEGEAAREVLLEVERCERVEVRSRPAFENKISPSKLLLWSMFLLLRMLLLLDDVADDSREVDDDGDLADVVVGVVVVVVVADDDVVVVVVLPVVSMRFVVQEEF